METTIWNGADVIPLNVDESGRVVIPAGTKLRQAIKLGELIVGVELAEGGFHVRTHADVIREIQKYAAQFIQPGESVVNELLAERRLEAERE